MAEKDSTEKILEAYNDVFADIVNVLLFKGEEVLKPDELVDQTPRSIYKADGKVREIERDVAKRWVKENIRIACIGLENQTDDDPDMPLRVMAYDGAEYRTELRGKDRYPVITLVLYFGYKKRWTAPTQLKECFSVPEQFKPYVSDYRINLFEIAYLEPETVKLFKSDFRIVADYFVQMRQNNDYNPEPNLIHHVEEILQLMSVMTHDHRYENAYNDSMKGGQTTMCEVLDRIENRGIARGIATGKETQAKSTAKNLYTMGLSIDNIAKAVGYASDVVRGWVTPPSGTENAK